MSSLFKLAYWLSGAFVASAALLNVTQFTPEEMLGAVRRGAALPNAEATLALYTTSQHSFQTHSVTNGLWVMNLTSGATWLYSNSSSVGDTVWLEGNTFTWLVREDDGTTSVKVGDATTPDAQPIAVGAFPGAAGGLKLTSTGTGRWGFVFNGGANRNGTLFNGFEDKTPVSSGLMYTTTFVRHWDHYLAPIKNSIWYGELSQSADGSGYSISEPINALNGTGFESPVEGTGGPDHYAISAHGLAFIAKDRTLLPSIYEKADPWYIPLTSFTAPPAAPLAIDTPAAEGYSTSLAFSPSGASLAFLRMKDKAYGADKNRIFIVRDVGHELGAREVFASDDGAGAWDRSPSSVLWSKDGASLYARAEDFARTRLFVLPADPATTQTPRLLFAEGTVSSVSWGPGDSLLVSSSSFLDNSIYSWVEVATAAASNATDGITLLSANLDHGARWGLSRDQVSEVFYQGAGDYQVHGWVIKPSTADPLGTYPLMFYVHGGPQTATADAWSIRWNMLAWAEQGYVVVAFNPTGSTGFGQSLTDGIQNQWGGRPYDDLVRGWEYIEANLPFVDTTRAMCLGSSYGGYMTNWIQGHDLGRKFKALFTHAGVFSTLSMYSTDEMSFMRHAFKGSLSTDWDNYARWNPANCTDQWATPHLITHGDRDFRLPIAEAISAFNVLQEKGIPSKLLVFPDENHYVQNPENSLVWHKTAMDWLNGHVGLPKYSQPGDEAYRATLMNGEWI